jgi:hypothetical protein
MALATKFEKTCRSSPKSLLKIPQHARDWDAETIQTLRELPKNYAARAPWLRALPVSRSPALGFALVPKLLFAGGSVGHMISRKQVLRASHADRNAADAARCCSVPAINDLPA